MQTALFHRGSPRTLAHAALSCLVAVSAAAHGSDWVLGAAADVRHDSNVGNAQPREDIVADTIVGARISAFQLFPVGTAYSFTAGGDLSGERYHDITGLDNVSADASLTLKRKWGLGAFAPWAAVGLSGGRSSYDASYRNAWQLRVNASAGRRIDERWNIWGEYAFDRRIARDQEILVPGISGDAFSTAAHTVTVHGELALTERLFVNLALSARHGDVISTSEESLRIYNASKALAEDPVFGDEQYAYTIMANTYGVRLGVDFSITAHGALSLAYCRYDTRGDGGNDYTKSIPELTWSFRF